MVKAVIWHNPHCSKSRETMEILIDSGVNVDVRNYLKEPPTVDEIKDVLQKLGLSAEEIVRKKEASYQKLHPSLRNSNDKLIQAMAKDPSLIERPIVISGDKAAIGRPPENVKSIL